MRIKKVFNNNVLLAEKMDGKLS
ncbi:hypothetical protein JYU32_14310 [Lactiplantibacillus plantarum]|nr:hypothetical protein [Lactiplantibacillus plantarum]MCT4456759.1 hypothetical protein [Lactiplantibacillus paraplantarum]MBW4808920.1 hypothetical protein [Lactiplantibacillus plantarum]MBW4811860.1 hypothetical protein [Lactiplantibacillus plantarum]MBY8838574.1 hypothetical protein [Lactiplantibacillus plantarum]